MPVGAAVLCPDGLVVEGNPAFETLTGYSLSEMRRFSLDDLLPPEDRHAWKELISSLLAKQRDSATLSTTFARKNNGVIFVSLFATTMAEGTMSSIIISAEKREPRSVVYSNKNGKGVEVATDDSGGLRVVNNWKWILTSLATALISISALLATWQTAHERSKSNSESIHRIEDRLDELMRKLSD